MIQLDFDAQLEGMPSNETTTRWDKSGWSVTKGDHS